MQVLNLVKGSAGYIKTEQDWRLVLDILHMTAMDPNDQVVAMDAILHIVTDPSMHPSAFRPCFDATLQFLERSRQVRIPFQGHCLEPLLGCLPAFLGTCISDKQQLPEPLL